MNSLHRTLNSFIKKYYLNMVVKGVAILLVILLPLYLLFSFLEYKGHFGSSVRGFIFFSFVLTGLAVMVKFIFIPLLKRIGLSKNRLDTKEAARIIGLHFGEVKDKLLNTLELSEKQLSNSNNLLLLASVEQKMSEMKPYNFFLAINKKETYRYLKFAGLAIVLLLSVAIFQGSILKEGGERIIKYNKEFIRKAPFVFNFSKPDAIKKGSDYKLLLQLIGDEVPSKASVLLNGEWVQMMESEDGNFYFDLEDLTETKLLGFKAGEFESERFKIPVLAPPSISNVEIELKYPAYTQRKSEKLQSTSSLIIPEGTKVAWNLSTNDTDSLKFAYNDKILEGAGYFTKTLKTSGSYSIILQSNALQQVDTMRYDVQVIKDKFPSITAIKKKDTLSDKLLYFYGTANDDYGLTQLLFCYQLLEENGDKSTLKKLKVPLGNSKNEMYSFVFDLNNIAFDLGSSVECYFELYDNDGVNGAKKSRSNKFIYKAPTKDELEERTEQGNSDLVAQMEEAMQDAKEIQKLTQELRVKMNNSKTMDWQEKKAVSNLLQKQKNLEQKIDQIKQKQEKLRTNEDEFKKTNPKVAEKQKKLDEMFKKTMSEEMKELFKKLEELLKQENKQELSKQLDKMNQADKDMSKQLERLQEQLKQLELEKKIEETADKLDDLAKKQEDLKQETKGKKQEKESLEKKQNELRNEFEGVKKDLQKIEDQNKDLKDKMNLKPTDQDQKNIEQSMENASEELKKGKEKKAGEQQQEAEDKMKELAKKMRENLEMEMKQREAEDYKTLRQLLENLISLSHEQEKTMTELKKQPGYTPRFIALSKQQQKIKRDAELIEDSLLALSKRNIKIQSFVNTEIGKINHHMEKTLEWLSVRNQYKAAVDQQYVMTSVNNLAVMLSESLKNMQMQMNKKNSGKKKVGQCKNPGMGSGKSQGKPKKGGKQPSMGSLKKLQQDLNNMSQERKEGKKPGSGKNGAMSAEDFVRMSNQQEALRRALEEVEKQLKEQGKQGALGDLNKTKKLMEEIEKDLVNKVLDNQTLQRQKQIEIRLSQHEEAEIKQEKDEQRQGETAKPNSRKIPPSLEPYLQELKRQQEILKSVPAEMAPYYQNKVQTYYILL